MASKCASKTLFVGNLHASLEENDLLEIFKPFGRIIECCKRWCHYGFIQFATEDEAKLAFSNLNGSKVRGRPMRIEFQRKKIRNIQALIEAEVGSKTKSQHGFDSFSYFSLGSNNENLNPRLAEDDDYLDLAEIEKCLTKVFDELLIDDNKHRENQVLKSITNVDQNSRCDKNNNKNSGAMCESWSIGSSCSSPRSQREDTASPAIRLFRSINSSNTIYVQPTDIIIPLNEGDYTEYKLFPSGDKSFDCSQHPLSTILKNWNNTANESNELYSPPISPASSDASCSNSSSLTRIRELDYKIETKEALSIEMNVNIQNQNPLLTKLSANTVSNSNGSSNSSATPRYALSINNNVANINNALLRNAQLSPKSKISLAQSANQHNNLFNSISNIQNYSMNIQSQLNYSASLNLKNQSHQHQHQQQQQQNSSLLTAASVLANNNINAHLYQSVQTTCNLNNTLFVGNLHASLQEIDLIQVFRPFGRIVECCKKWLHFGFVKFTTEEEACHAYVTLNGFRLKGRPMRLEFQNRTKKARIKAILAQAALQAANGSTCNTDLLSMSNVNIANMNGIQMAYSSYPDDRQQSMYQNAAMRSEAKESSFFNSDQLIKFASTSDNPEPKNVQFELNFDLAESNNYYDLNSLDMYSASLFDARVDTKLADEMQHSDKRGQSDDFLLGLLKRQHSPSSAQEALSLSSDSGCRSNSFLNDEDSAITSIQSSVRTVTKSKAKGKKLEEVTLSEHLEFTCSKSSPIKEEKEEFSKLADEEINDEEDDDDCSSDCDTSDDASDIPSEADGDSDCLNDLDLLDENFLNGSDFECDEEAKYFNQVMEKDGSIIRKKLDNGIYKSVNATHSLYIEPHDVLKQVDMDEFDEYSLFPTDPTQPLFDSLVLIKKLCCV